MTLDYSMWLTPERLEAEEVLWAEVGIYRLYAEHVMRTAAEHGCRSVIELGCGTGWVPTLLPASLHYVGVDANEGCLNIAQTKTPIVRKFPGRIFLQEDIRKVVRPVGGFDLVCSFAVLKHFSLEEWPAIVHKVLSLGRVGLFTMNVGPLDLDDFEQGFAHTWVSYGTLSDAVYEAGHRVTTLDVLETTETMVTTCIR